MLTQCKECYLPLSDCRCVPSVMASRGCVAHIKLAPFSDERYAATRGLVLALKESADMRYYRALAELLIPSLKAAIEARNRSALSREQAPVADTVITYLPRTRFAQRLHGVDQAACLARALVNALGVKCLQLFRRKRGASVQKKLSRRERLANAKGSIVLTKKARKKYHLGESRVILVDDIVTTGASMAAAAELLQVAEWMAVSIAITPKAEK